MTRPLEGDVDCIFAADPRSWMSNVTAVRLRGARRQGWNDWGNSATSRVPLRYGSRIGTSLVLGSAAQGRLSGDSGVLLSLSGQANDTRRGDANPLLGHRTSHGRSRGEYAVVSGICFWSSDERLNESHRKHDLDHECDRSDQ